MSVVHLAGWHPAKPNEACDCETNNKHQLLLYRAKTYQLALYLTMYYLILPHGTVY